MTDSKTDAKVDGGRRGFLTLAAAAPVAAAVATGSAARADEAAPETGLKDTDQTRAYYASARF